MRQVRNTWFLTVKDLKLFVSDRAALFFAILFPFLFIVLFNFVLTGVGSEDTRLELNLATREPAGAISYQIISGLETKDETALLPGQPKINWIQDYEQARKDVEDKKITGFVGFPEDFTQAVLMGYGTQLEVVYNASDTQAIAALKGLAQSIASEVGTQQVVNNTVIGLLVENEIVSPGLSGDLAQAIREILAGQYNQAGQPVAPSPLMISVNINKVGDVQAENPSNFVIPGYLVMFTFFAAATNAAQIVKERQNHTLERLLANSASKAAILGGVFSGTAVKGLIQITIFWAFGVMAFSMSLGAAPGAVILISLLTVVMSSAFGVMLATLVKTERSAASIGVLTSLILAPLGGCWWPLFITPQWMQTVSKITPHVWATTAFNKLLVFGADFGSVIPEMLVLAGFAVVFTAIALMRFKTDAE